MLILAVLVVAFLGFVFTILWQILRFLAHPELQEISGPIYVLMQRIPTLIFTATFFGIFITSFGVLLQALYLSGDMDFLLATPVPIRAVFVAKLLQAIVPNFLLICLFALPALFGYALSTGFSPIFYPAALMMMIALALAAAGISALLVMVVVRIFPARRIAEILGFLGAIFSFICSQTGQLAQLGDFNNDQAAGALVLMERVDLAWSPLTWAANGVSALGNRDWGRGAGLTLTALILAVGIFAFSLSTAERLYYTGWAGMGSVARRKRPAKSRASGNIKLWWSTPGSFIVRAAARTAAPIPAAVRALVIKDWLVLRRDLRNLSQIVTPLILGIVYAFMVLNGDSNAPNAGDEVPPLIARLINAAATYTSVGLSLFVSWMLLARLAGMGFAQEGKSYWLLKTAPVRVRDLILAKYLVAFVPTYVLSAAYLLGIWLLERAPGDVLLFSLVVIAAAIAGNTGINLAFGIAGANMAWEDPRQMQRSSVGCLGAAVTLAYLPLILILFFGPPVFLPLLGISSGTAQIIGFIIGGMVSLACAVGPLWLVRRRVEQFGEL